jgi:hypothetical protein
LRSSARATRSSLASTCVVTSARADDLKHYLCHEPVRARAPTTWYRASRFVRRNRLGVLFGLVTMLGLIAATATSLVKMSEAAEQCDLAVRERARADAQVEFQRILLSTAGDEKYPMRKLLDASMHQTHTLLYFAARTVLAQSLSSSGQSRASVQLRVEQGEQLVRDGGFVETGKQFWHAANPPALIFRIE